MVWVFPESWGHPKKASIDQIFIDFSSVEMSSIDQWYVPSSKSTVWPWKSPIFNGNESSNPDNCQGQTVNLPEGTYHWSMDEISKVYNMENLINGYKWMI